MGDECSKDPEPDRPEACPTNTGNEKAVEDEVGDFISGHVLEKDTVFFEG